MKKGNLYILVIIIVILALLGKEDTSIPLQAVIPDCFEHEDCKVPILKDYCDVSYGCVSGKCYSTQIKCPEICYGGEDEDMDNLIDCKDSNCFDSIYCPCLNTGYTGCLLGNCYCNFGSPSWVVTEGNGECRCS